MGALQFQGIFSLFRVSKLYLKTASQKGGEEGIKRIRGYVWAQGHVQETLQQKKNGTFSQPWIIHSFFFKFNYLISF